MAKKITKAINSQFIPTYIGGYPLFAYGGKKKYGLGSFLNKAGNFALDSGKLLADNSLSVFGATDVIKDDMYKNKAFKDISGVTSKIYKGAGQVAANVIAPGVGGAVMGGIQSGVGSVAGDQSKAVNEQQAALEDQAIQQQQQMLKSQAIDNLPAQHDYRPTFAYGGGLKGAPQGKATKEDIKRFEKQYPEEMQMGVQVEYEHTKNKDLAKRIAADHIKDFEKMYGTAGYYQGLKEFGLTDELAMGGVMNSYAGGGSMSPNLDNTTVYANGGSHESNPLSGIPLGNNSLVEENEVRFNDYVFSDRISYKRK